MISKNAKIFISGHKGLVGSSIIKLLKEKKFTSILTRSKKQLNLLNQQKTYEFLKVNKPDAVIIASAKVGGINANNKFRADFLFENLQIQNNLIHGSYLSGVKKLIFLGSSCIYPKKCKQPIKEEYLLNSSLEYTNEPYAIAKIAGVKMVENYNKQYQTNYLCLMPCNLYGQNDNYDLDTSHFLPALIKKIFLAKKYNHSNVTLWGNGKAKRELMHVDDLSSACLIFLNKKVRHHYINIGSGEEFRIIEYAKKIAKIFNYNGKLVFDSNMPNGTPRKILDSTLANSYGWKSKIPFDKGITEVCLNFNHKQ